MSLLVTMLSMVTFLIFCVGFVSSNAIVFYGTIGSTSCTKNLTLTWSECVAECNSNTSDCILAFNDDSNNCNLCSYGQVTNVTYTDISTDTEIALKLSNEVDCNSVISQLKNGKIDELKQCQDGWKKYTREKTEWCVTQIRPNNTGFNYTNAVKLCKKLDAIVSGVENLEELQQFTDEMTVGAWVSNYQKINDSFEWNDDTYVSGFDTSLFNNQNLSENIDCATITGSILAQTTCSVAGSFGAICGKPIW